MEDYMIGEEYTQLESPKHEDIKATLRAKKYFAFDLDDTLHNFRAGSGAALEVVLAKLNKDHGTDVDVTRKTYLVILKEKTSSAFIDGRTSREYRKERFEALMKQENLNCDASYLDNLADLYQRGLSQSLCLKPGAMDLLKLLKSMGKYIIIITEGPEDAQIWTIKQLGIQDLVDFVATTNRFRVSKVDGLLEKVMEMLEISASDLVCVGDNWGRDIEPAVRAGVFAIHYAEGESMLLDRIPIWVNSHRVICSMLDSISGSNG